MSRLYGAGIFSLAVHLYCLSVKFAMGCVCGGGGGGRFLSIKTYSLSLTWFQEQATCTSQDFCEAQIRL